MKQKTKENRKTKEKEKEQQLSAERLDIAKHCTPQMLFSQLPTAHTWASFRCFLGTHQSLSPSVAMETAHWDMYKTVFVMSSHPPSSPESSLRSLSSIPANACRLYSVLCHPQQTLSYQRAVTTFRLDLRWNTHCPHFPSSLPTGVN